MTLGSSLNNKQSWSDLVVESDDDFRVATRIYRDASVFEEEMTRIFEGTWVYVGHTSEVPRRGDYKTTTIGRNPVIVTHTDSGEICVLLNACRHRANAVCRQRSGSARHFTCPYHGWVYSNSGALVGVTESKGYPPDFAAKLGGLIRFRTEVYRGLIFASMNESVPSLEEHLGDLRKYIDLWADLSPEPEFRVSKPHHYGYLGNWKFQCENGHDGWHARYTHGSAFETVADFGGPALGHRSTVGRTRGFARGCGILERPGIQQGMSDEQLAEYRKLLLARHAPERVDLIWYVRHIFVFPNLFIFDNLLRVIQPDAVDRTTIVSYPLLPSGIPDEFNQARLPELQMRLGTAGLVNPDDLEMFASNQTGMRSERLEWVTLSHALGQDQPVAGSEMIGEDNSELPQRSIYREWRRLMSAQ